MHTTFDSDYEIKSFTCGLEPQSFYEFEKMRLQGRFFLLSLSYLINVLI